jgi:hypothetical protein
MTTTARTAHLRDLLVDELTAYTRRSTNAETLLLSIGQDCFCTEDDDAECTCLDDGEARAQAAAWATLAAAAATTMQALSALVVAEEATA